MRCVWGNVTEKGFVAVFLDVLDRLPKPDIGAVAGILDRPSIEKIGIVKIGIAPVVGGLRKASSFMPQHMLKASVFRAKRIVVAQVPFPK